MHSAQVGIYYPPSTVLTPLQEPWFSGQLHNVPFGTWCPAVITILAIVIDFLARRQLPKIIQVTWSALSAPFRNFITLDDVEGPFDDDFPQQIWIIRALVSIALLSSFSWLAYFGYTIVLQEPWTNALVASIAWVGLFNILLHVKFTL